MMFYLKKLCIDNKIPLNSLPLGNNIRHKIRGYRDFTLQELEDIKKFLINLNIIDKNFDIGDFLNEV